MSISYNKSLIHRASIESIRPCLIFYNCVVVLLESTYLHSHFMYPICYCPHLSHHLYHMCVCYVYLRVFPATVFTVLLSTLALYIGALGASRILHKQLLQNVLRAPLASFFDVTPLGRVLNRFSKDVDTTDTDLPATLRAWSACFFGVPCVKCIFFYCGGMWCGYQLVYRCWKLLCIWHLTL